MTKTTTKSSKSRTTASYAAPSRKPITIIHEEYAPGQDGRDGRPFDAEGGFYAHASYTPDADGDDT